MKFTAGMAVYDNPPAFYESMRARFTAMSLLHQHPMVDEIIIVDNHPVQGNPLQDLATSSNGQIRYIPMSNPVGTAAPRNRIFAEAKNPYVAVLDPHVLLYPDTFPALAAFYDEYGLDCPDVLHGPMVTERKGRVYAHHMNDQWRCQMWGTWGRAWINPDGIYFSCVTLDERTLHYRTLNMEGEQQRINGRDLGLPMEMEWPCHEKKLEGFGCREVQSHNDPFLIPGHGMGFFACRRDDWLPFHPDCRGFGGEEMTTAVRFRQAGRQAWCVPGAQWWHDFHRPFGGGTPYRLTTWDKARNYVLEFNRLGLDPTPIRTEFNMSVIPESEWRMILAGKVWPDKLPDGVNPKTFCATPELAHELQLREKRKPLAKHELGK